MSSITYLFESNMAHLLNLDFDPSEALSDQEYDRIIKETDTSTEEEKHFRSEAARFAANCFYKYGNGREFQSEHWINYWSNTENRKQKSKTMSEYKQSEVGKMRSKESAQAYWDNMTEEQRSDFRDTMKKVNNDPEKIEKSSSKHRDFWKDPEYQARMAKRKRGSNSKSMKEKWADPEWKAMMLQKRKEARENKQCRLIDR